MSLANDITEFCVNVIARPCKRDELIREVIKMATHNPAWPKASYEDWSKAIEQAIAQKKLIAVSETVWIPIQTLNAQPKQMEMF